MTPSGKPDRTRLSESLRDAVVPRATATASMTPLERLVARHFCEVLGVEEVGLYDDFFADLGGHSLVATRLMGRLRESTGIDVPLRTIFDAPTPAALATAIERISGDKVIDSEIDSILAEIAALPAGQSSALLQSLKVQTEEDKA